MGGNGSFSKIYGKEITNKNTHIEYGERIGGHKILIQQDNIGQVKIPVNSHSECPTYLLAKVDMNGVVQIKTVSKYKNHKLIETIDIVTDKDGKFVPYSKGHGSHSHLWQQDQDGKIGRKSHNSRNTFPISSSDMNLIESIVDFNNKHKKWNK